MATASLVPVEEYLSSSYEPDCEYVEGQLIERNVGESKHGFLELLIGMTLKTHGLLTFVEARFQIRQNRFRIPDVMALAPGRRPDKGYQRAAPYIVVEILSPDDRKVDVDEKVLDYFERNVPNIWIVDPVLRTLTVCEPGVATGHTDGVVTTDGMFSVDIADLFRQMDESGVE